MPDDPSWRKFFDEIPRYDEKPAFVGVLLNGQMRREGFDAWRAINVYDQIQSGFAVASVTVPLGDLSSDQMRKLAELTHRYAGDHARLTVEQNVVLRWVPQNKLIDLYKDLAAIGLADAGAGSI